MYVFEPSQHFNQLVKDILNDPPWNKIEIPVDFENPLLRDLINIDDKREAEFLGGNLISLEGSVRNTLQSA